MLVLLPETRTTIEIPRLRLMAEVRAGGVNVEKRTAELVWTTGAKVLRGFYNRFYEELSLDRKHVRMERLKSGRAPVLDAHNRWSLRDQIGVVEDAELKSDSGTALVRFSKREDVEPIFRDVADGIIRNVSIGYDVHLYRQVEKADDKIPTYRAEDWEPFEISPVPVGADAGAGFRSEVDGGDEEADPSGRPARRGPKHFCTFVSRSKESTTMEPSTTPPAATEQPQPPTAEESRAAQDAGRKAEKERIAGIQRAVAAAGLDAGEARTIEQELVAKDLTVDQARARVLDHLATKHEASRTDQHVRADRVEVVEMEAEKWQRGAGAALLVRTGYAELLAAAAKKQPDARAFRGLELDPGEFRGMTMLDLARESLERAGVKTRGMTKMELVGKAFTHRSSGMASTSDFPILLENTLHKVLQAAYAMAEDTWRQFCAVGSVGDFRAHNRYRLGSFGALDAVPESGEFKYKAIPDGEKGSITASTKGNLIALTRQAIINDDLGQFMSLAQRLGRAAGLSIEADVYALLALNSGLGPTQSSDSQPLFHSNRANVGTGATLSVASIDADRVIMASQKDPALKEYLSLRPAVLLVPIGLGGAARVINQAQYDVDPVTTNATNKFQMPNKVVGLFRSVVDTPRLTGTRRYLLADPAIAPVIEVAFLDGNQAPFMETQEGWNIDGTSWKVRIDYGVAAVDFRGAVTNAGTP